MRQVVATRFVRACPKGHVDDLDWYWFVHGTTSECLKNRQLWLDERGISGDLADLVVRCECKRSRGLYEAMLLEVNPWAPAAERVRGWARAHTRAAIFPAGC